MLLLQADIVLLQNILVDLQQYAVSTMQYTSKGIVFLFYFRPVQDRKGDMMYFARKNLMSH